MISVLTGLNPWVGWLKLAGAEVSGGALRNEKDDRTRWSWLLNDRGGCNVYAVCKSGKFLRHIHYWLKNIRMIWKLSEQSKKCPNNLENVSGWWYGKCPGDLKILGKSGKFPDDLKRDVLNFAFRLKKSIKCLSANSFFCLEIWDFSH